MKVKLLVSAGVVIAALTGSGCGGSGGGGGGPTGGGSLAGNITTPTFNIPAGTTKTVTGDLTVNASQGIEIDGTLVIPEGVNVALITDGPLNIKGQVTEPAVAVATTRQSSGGSGGSNIVLSGSTITVNNQSTMPNGANVSVSTNAPAGDPASITVVNLVLGKGKAAPDTVTPGGPGPKLEIGTVTANTAATQSGAKNARTPDNVTVTLAVAGTGGNGFDDRVGIDNGTKVTAAGTTAGGRGGDLNIAAKNAPVIKSATAGTGGRGGLAQPPGKAAAKGSKQKGEDYFLTTGDGGDGGNVSVTPTPTGTATSGPAGEPGSATATAQSGGPDGGDGGSVTATIGKFGKAGTGGSTPGVTYPTPLSYTLGSGQGGDSNDTKVPGGKGGSVTLADANGGVAPTPSVQTYLALANGGAGAGVCSVNNPPAGSNGGAMGLITCHGLNYSTATDRHGGDGGSGNGPGKAGSSGSDDSGRVVGITGHDGSWCTPPKGATYQSTISVPGSSASFCTLDTNAQIMYCMDADTNKTNVFQVNLGTGMSQSCSVGAPITDVNSGLCNSNTATRGTGLIYVSSGATNSVVILNEQSGAKTGSIKVPAQIGPGALAFDPAKGRLYASVEQGVEVFDTTNGNKLLGTIATTVNAYSMAFNSANGLLYLGNFSTKQVAVLDTVAMTQKNSITLSDYSGCVTVNPVTGTVYASLYYSSSVIAMSPDLSQTLATIKVGPNPWGIGVDSKRNRVYVANYNYSSPTLSNGSLTEFDGSTNAIMTTVTLGKGPTGVSVDENADKIYVAEFGESGLAVLNGN